MIEEPASFLGLTFPNISWSQIKTLHNGCSNILVPFSCLARSNVCNTGCKSGPTVVDPCASKWSVKIAVCLKGHKKRGEGGRRKQTIIISELEGESSWTSHASQVWVALSFLKSTDNCFAPSSVAISGHQWPSCSCKQGGGPIFWPVSLVPRGLIHFRYFFWTSFCLLNHLPCFTGCEIMYWQYESHLCSLWCLHESCWHSNHTFEVHLAAFLLLGGTFLCIAWYY